MITQADAAQMIAGLRSGQLAIRQISKFFLENAFGDHVVMFDPKAGPGARAKAVREWNAALRKISDHVLRKTKRS
jgi:hypothetical protein